jgi:hypothetical protein
MKGHMRRDLGVKRCLAHGSLLFLTFALLSGCSGVSRKDEEALRGIESGIAKRLLQQRFDAAPQCAQVLTTDANGLMRAAPDSPAARALLDAKLIVLDPRPGPANSATRFFTPAPAAQRWFSQTSAETTVVPTYLLCFARREVSAIWLDPSGAAPMYRYGFRLVDPAPWLADPAIRKAFPTLRAAFAIEFVGDEHLPSRDGNPDLSKLKPTDRQTALFAFQVNFGNRVED